MPTPEVTVSMGNLKLPKNAKKSGITVYMGEHGKLSMGQGTIKWYPKGKQKPEKSLSWAEFAEFMKFAEL